MKKLRCFKVDREKVASERKRKKLVREKVEEKGVEPKERSN